MKFHPLRLKPSHLFDIKTAEPVRRRCGRGGRWKSTSPSDLAPNSVTGSELAAASVTGDKVAFGYAGSTSAGGPAADVACLGCVGASEVSFSFATLGANTFTATQTIDTGNLDLDLSTATTGTITKNGTPFLHDFGANNTFLSRSA